MKTGTIKIAGKSHLICLSTRVIVEIEDRFGDYESGLNEIMAAKKIKDLFWLISRMIAAGTRYAAMEGLETAGNLTEDELYDLTDVGSYESIFSDAIAAVAGGLEPKIEAVASKNGKTTQRAR